MKKTNVLMSPETVEGLPPWKVVFCCCFFFKENHGKPCRMCRGMRNKKLQEVAVIFNNRTNNIFSR